MAKLSAFRTDSAAIKGGEWIRVGEEYDDLEILTRGITDEYLDAQATRQRRAANGFNGDVSKIPSAIRRAINVECLVLHTVIDLRNLQHDDGAPVTLAQFQDLLRNPDYGDLVVACYKAAGQVGVRRKADSEEASGNFAPPSVTA
jgi:hypothetical protein